MSEPSTNPAAHLQSDGTAVAVPGQPLSANPTDVTPAATPRNPAGAWLHVGSNVRFWGVAITGLALDLWSKEAVFHWLRQDHDPVILVPGLLSFQTMFNPGALFGIGAGKTTAFLIASFLALLLVFWMFGQSSPRRRLLQIALGAVLAGALGNMYDRMFVRLTEVRVSGVRHHFVREDQPDGRVLLHEYPQSTEHPPLIVPAERTENLPQTMGYVRDFIKINSTFGGREIWPWVFNVADMLLVCGVGILAIHMWRDRKPDEAPPQLAR